jgi:Set1/Ash2 histone methyltransferase complex subunit ASH2
LKTSLRKYWSRFYTGKPEKGIVEGKLEATLQLYEEIYFTRADGDGGDGAWSLVSGQILSADLQARPAAFDMAATETATKAKKPAAKKPATTVDTRVDADAELESLGLKPSKGLRKKMQRLAATTVFSNLDFDRPNPSGQPLVLSRAPTHTAQQMAVQGDSLTVSNANGFAMARATHGFEFGTWHFEVEILAAAGNCRLGVAQILAEAQAPVGFDEYGYGYRDRDGRLLHCGRSEAYGEPFGPGDVIGVTMVLPASPADANTSDDAVRCEREARFPPKRLGAYKVRQEILSGGHSHFQFAVNGRPQGRAFPDPYRAKYYPAVSLYGGAACRLNFGPDFKFPCPPAAKPAYLIQDEEAHEDGNENQQ